MFHFAALTVALATSATVEMELDAKPIHATAGWSVSGPAPATAGLDLQFFVKQTNTDQLETTLMAVSDPDSPTYGQHLSNEQAHALVAPTPASIAAVMAFLRDHGVAGVRATPNGDIIEAKVTVQQAERMLQTRYHVVVHNDSGTEVHRAQSYALPDKVAAAVDFVCPTVHLPPVRNAAVAQTPKAVRSPLTGNTPKHLRELYSVDVEGKAPDNKMAVTAFLNQHYSKADLSEFWKMYCSGITCGKGEPTVKGDGSIGFGAGIESMLDIETITGIAGNIHAEFWGYKGKSPDNSANEPFMKWLSQLANTSDTDVPKVFSTSYGEDEDAWSLPAAIRMNTEFQKAGVRGISLLYAAGDEGANCKGDPDKFVPETPGSSPWVTSVGGTQGATNEQAIGLSSGGFSNRWPMPQWQAAAVASYFANGQGLPSPSVGYNKTGRAYPDIAAQASDFTVVANRIPEPGVAGTSCASPTASGVIALINDARLQAGQSVLGYLNPWIYKNAKAWNDITTGSSEGCGIGAKGWPAAVGWDAVTGVGTPNYKNLVATNSV
jgi:tripeptidyl-peptidase-1